MRKKVLLIFISIVCTVFFTVIAWASTSVSDYTGYTYTHNSRFDNAHIINAIDVSQYQGAIDWNKVKVDGIEYAIIRIGGRGYAASGRLYYDDYYKINIENAKKAGVKIGIYYFSQARTEAEAREEALHCLQLLGSYDIDLPIFMDYEYASDSVNPGRIQDLTTSQRTANAVAFCETIETAGYEAGFYSNLLFLQNSIDGRKLSDLYSIWIAQYNNRCDYDNAYSIWQYSSSGAVDGINGRVDCNFWYKIYMDTFDAALSYSKTEYDGNPKEPTVTVEGLKNGRDFTVRYVNNQDAGTATAVIEGKGLYTGMLQKTFVIEPADISDMTAVLSYDETAYDGTAKTPEVVIQGLVEGKDFTVSYKDNTEVGTATVTVTGQGNYRGSLKLTFMIKDRLTGSEAVFSQTNKLRIYGDNRYSTAMYVADKLKISVGTDKFRTVIVASGENYADALSGSYLAYINNAPILMVNSYNEAIVRDYIKTNLEDGGKIYILGGSAVVSSKFENSFSGYRVERLGGATRFETNLAILQECSLTDEELVICSGMDYADSLSASSTRKPILLVDDKLDSEQLSYVKKLSSKNFYIIGGTGAVTSKVETQIKSMGKKYQRICGENRYETSMAVAEYFFGGSSEAIVLAYGMDFPDGLVSGPLAASLQAPVLLVNDYNLDHVRQYADRYKTGNFAAIMGPSLLSDEAYDSIVK